MAIVRAEDLFSIFYESFKVLQQIDVELNSKEAKDELVKNPDIARMRAEEAEKDVADQMKLFTEALNKYTDYRVKLAVNKMKRNGELK